MDAQTDLIFDIGVNKGEDTAFYLAKGFRVVGVEANPSIYQTLAEKFEKEVSSGQLVLLNQGVWSEATTLQFYSNLDNDHWSSFDPAYGCRQGTRYEVMLVNCLTIDQLIEAHGVPRYMKIDVEGADRKIIEGLAISQVRPSFLSIEEYGLEAIDALQAVGYDRFQMVPQRDKSKAIPPNPSREGNYVFQKFSGYDSGLFGRELPNDWLDFDQARLEFQQSVRTQDGRFVGPEYEWFDIHATTVNQLSGQAEDASKWWQRLWHGVASRGQQPMAEVA